MTREWATLTDTADGITLTLYRDGQACGQVALTPAQVVNLLVDGGTALRKHVQNRHPAQVRHDAGHRPCDAAVPSFGERPATT